jgi:hypothetical protein
LPLLLGFVTLTGCGTNDAASKDSGELLRYEISAGKLRFVFGEPQDSVVPIPDSLLVVQTDGEATYKFADQPEIEFQLEEADLSRLESDLDEIDFEEASDTIGGPTKKGLPAFSVTHDGTTVDLGDRFTAINEGEGPAVADQMNDLLSGLDKTVNHAPGVDDARNNYIRSHPNG